MNALKTRAAALAAFRDGDSGNTALEGCVRAGVYGMAGFVRVAPAPALVAGGGLAFAESALDHAELKIPNVALTLGRIPRQRHHPRLQWSSPELCVKVRGSSSMLLLGCLGDLLRFEKREIQVATFAPDSSSP